MDNKNLNAHILPRGSRLKNGAYAIGEVLGQGGFGITYKGGDMTLRRYVAIKEFFPSGARRHETRILPPASTCDEDHQRTVRNFLEEARTLSRFDHPNIVRVLDAFHDNNTTYMVMELLDGDSLAAQLAGDQPLENAVAVEYALQVLAALEQVHNGGWLHRDVKPENIVITPENRAVLIDFGTARQSSAFTQRLTQIVTPGYAPLEQYAQNARRAPASDIYALGATLYHLLTGQKPTDATDRAADVPLPSARELNPRVGRALDAVVSAALAMKISERPQSAGEFAQMLRAASEERDAKTEIAPVQVLAPSPDDTMPMTNLAAIPRAIGLVLALSQQTSRHALGINRLTFSHDGQMLASAGQDKVLNLWNPRLRAVSGVLRAHEAAITSCAFTPDASQIISGSIDCSVRAWDVATRQNTATWTHDSPLHALAVHPSAHLLACADENALQLRDLASGETVRELEFVAQALAFSPDGRWLAAGGATGWALWETSTGRLCHVGMEKVAVKDLAWSQQNVLAGACEDGFLRGWGFDGEGARALWEFGINRMPLFCVAFSGDGSVVGTSGMDCIVRLWSVQTGALLKFHSRHKRRVGSLAFAPQGNILVSGSSDTNLDFCRMQSEFAE